ncbi:hypothetical protein I926_08595 [Pasteurella multocida subsp. multocida OH4807]|nr:hypothetical protein I926_08595 [Pasteurella multocida subsp. multocida OH4807]
MVLFFISISLVDKASKIKIIQKDKAICGGCKIDSIDIFSKNLVKNNRTFTERAKVRSIFLLFRG